MGKQTPWQKLQINEEDIKIILLRLTPLYDVTLQQICCYDRLKRLFGGVSLLRRTLHKLKFIKVHTSMIFSIYVWLGSHSHYIEYFHSPKEFFHDPFQSIFSFNLWVSPVCFLYLQSSLFNNFLGIGL